MISIYVGQSSQLLWVVLSRTNLMIYNETWKFICYSTKSCNKKFKKIMCMCDSVFIRVRSLIKWSKDKNTPPPMPHDLHVFRFTITFASSFTMGNANVWGNIWKWGEGLDDYSLVLGLLFWESPTQGFYSTQSMM
jgi:hypothetical protein